jgi:hypothetical protein
MNYAADNSLSLLVKIVKNQIEFRERARGEGCTKMQRAEEKNNIFALYRIDWHIRRFALQHPVVRRKAQPPPGIFGAEN